MANRRKTTTRRGGTTTIPSKWGFKCPECASLKVVWDRAIAMCSCQACCAQFFGPPCKHCGATGSSKPHQLNFGRWKCRSCNRTFIPPNKGTRGVKRNYIAATTVANDDGQDIKRVKVTHSPQCSVATTNDLYLYSECASQGVLPFTQSSHTRSGVEKPANEALSSLVYKIGDHCKRHNSESHASFLRAQAIAALYYMTEVMWSHDTENENLTASQAPSIPNSLVKELLHAISLHNTDKELVGWIMRALCRLTLNTDNARRLYGDNGHILALIVQSLGKFAHPDAGEADGIILQGLSSMYAILASNADQVVTTQATWLTNWSDVLVSIMIAFPEHHVLQMLCTRIAYVLSNAYARVEGYVNKNRSTMLKIARAMAKRIAITHTPQARQEDFTKEENCTSIAFITLSRITHRDETILNDVEEALPLAKMLNTISDMLSQSLTFQNTTTTSQQSTTASSTPDTNTIFPQLLLQEAIQLLGVAALALGQKASEAKTIADDGHAFTIENSSQKLMHTISNLLSNGCSHNPDSLCAICNVLLKIIPPKGQRHPGYSKFGDMARKNGIPTQLHRAMELHRTHPKVQIHLYGVLSSRLESAGGMEMPNSGEIVKLLAEAMCINKQANLVSV